MHTSKPFYSGYFIDRVLLIAQAVLDWDPSIFKLSLVARMVGVHHCTQLFFHLEEVLQTFLPGLPGTAILLILASQVAGITSVSHQHLASWRVLSDRGT
jgi:hypothetical protein